MDNIISKEEFAKIYQEKFEPVAKELEPVRLENIEKKKSFSIKYLIFSIIFIAVAVGVFLSMSIRFDLFFFVVLFLAIIYFCTIHSINEKERKILKKSLVSKILSVFGNIYFSESKDIIPLLQIKKMGLFSRAMTKTDDDTIIGVYKGCNFVINECKMTHTEGSGKNSTTVTDFDGIIVKIQMHKKFTSQTIVGVDNHIRKLRGFEDVQLESVEFMKNRKVYSTDQIEARYILTTSFIERLEQLGKVFNCNFNSQYSSSPFASKIVDFLGIVAVSAAFVDGYAYLFVPNSKDFFEINTRKTLLNSDQYYGIYVELSSILNIVEYMKFDQKLGL